MSTSSPEIETERIAVVACGHCRQLLDVAAMAPFEEFACPHCGTRQKVPARFGGFLLLELLGRGGMGAVYHGIDEQLDRHVAAKVLQASIGADANLVATFRREAQSAAALNHPNVVQVYSFGMERGQPYMAMELLNGGRLDQMIAKGEPLNELFVMTVGASIAQGLSAASEIGLIHGDVKPENILFDNSGVPKIVDFGLSTFVQHRQIEDGVWGTPYYIAPEKVRRQTSDARSDIYSLGATLFHALTGQPPFDGETPVEVVKARLLAPPLRVETLRPELSQHTSEIIARMLEIDPARRYPNYASLLGDLPKNTKLQSNQSSRRMSRTGRNFSSKKLPSISSKTDLFVNSMPPNLQTSNPRAAASLKGTKLRRLFAIVGGALLVAVVGMGILALVLNNRKLRAEALSRQQASAALSTDKEAAAQQVSNILRSLQNLPSVADVDNAVGSEAPWLTNKVNQLLASFPVEMQMARRADAEQLVESLRTATQYVVRTFGEARRIRAQARAQRNAIVALTNTATDRAALLAAFSVLRLEATDAVSNGLVGLSVVTQSVAQLRGFVTNLERQAALTSDQTKAQRVQKAELAVQAKEMAERQQAEKPKALLAEKELGAVAAARQAVQEHVLRNDFQMAAKALRNAGVATTTALAREALAVEIERCERLVQLKAYLVEAIQKEAAIPPQSGFRYGWLVAGVPALDVLGATADTIGLPARQVSWSEVDPAQMLRFLAHYVEQNEDLERQTRAAQFLSAALYVRAVGGDNERAVALAAKYVNQARALDAALGPTVARLMSPGDRS